MISTKERKEKVKNSHYWGLDTNTYGREKESRYSYQSEQTY